MKNEIESILDLDQSTIRALLPKIMLEALMELLSNPEQLRDIFVEVTKEALQENKDKILAFYAGADNAGEPTPTVDSDLEHKLKMIAGMKEDFDYTVDDLQNFIFPEEENTEGEDRRFFRAHTRRIRDQLVEMGAIEKVPGAERGPMVRWRLRMEPQVDGFSLRPGDLEPLDSLPPKTKKRKGKLKSAQEISQAALKVLQVLREAGRTLDRQVIQKKTDLPIHKVAAALIELRSAGLVEYTAKNKKSLWSLV